MTGASGVTRAEKHPLNLNQIMLAEEVAQGRGPWAPVRRHSKATQGGVRNDRSASRQGRGMVPNVLSIAGSDPSGGAGIQADLKAIAANGGYGMAALTALTAQNTRGVFGVHPVPPDFLHAQIAAVFDDIRVDAVKIGMLGTPDLVRVVAEALDGRVLPVVLDPVMVAKGGDRLLAAEAVAALRDLLLPMATVVTPNLPEAADLLGV